MACCGQQSGCGCAGDNSLAGLNPGQIVAVTQKPLLSSAVNTGGITATGSSGQTSVLKYVYTSASIRVIYE